MMRKLICLFCFLLIAVNLFSQNSYTITGKVFGEDDKLALPGATVFVTNLLDSLDKKLTASDMSGAFSLEVQPGKYLFTVLFMGFNKYNDTVEVRKNLHVGAILLSEKALVLNEISVVGEVASVIQKGDTTVYNPNAFKVNLDATAKDLLLKMPGFYNQEGTVMAKGDTVKQVLIDGKKYFGNNVDQALQAMSPDLIKEIEVFQYEDDASKHSGFENSFDGKTINIVTKNKKDALLRGELALGAGKNEHYASEARVQRFSQKSRMYLDGNLNNVNAPIKINKSNYGSSAISGDETNNSDLRLYWGLAGDTELSVSYFFNNSKNLSKGYNSQEYIDGALMGQTNNEENSSESSNVGHNANLIWRNSRKSKNRVSANLNVSGSNSDNIRLSNSETQLNQALINSNLQNSSSNSCSYNIKGDVNYTRRLNKKGRTVSFLLDYALSNNTNDRGLLNETFDDQGQTSNLIDQSSSNNGLRMNTSLGASFTEKLGKLGRLLLGYTYKQSLSQTDKKTYDFDEEVNSYSLLDTLSSNEFDNKTMVHTARIGLTRNKRKMRIHAGFDLMNTTMENSEFFPENKNLSESFVSVRPNLRLSYTTAKKASYRLQYHLNQGIPSLDNLQDVVDNSNPLRISTGNPDLRLSSTHNLVLSMSKFVLPKSLFMNFSIRASAGNNIVAQNRVVALNDTTVLGAYFLPAGGELSRPVNLNGNYTVSANAMLGFSLSKLKLKFNTRSSLTYNQMPGILNNVKSITERYSTTQSFTLSSNFSEKIDFTISSNTTWSLVQNTSNTNEQPGYLSQNTRLNFYWNFYKKLIFKVKGDHTFHGSSGVLASQNRWNINAGLSLKMFKNNKGELSFTAFDLFNYQNSVNRQINDFYIAESYSPSLNNFYMLSFSYKL